MITFLLILIVAILLFGVTFMRGLFLHIAMIVAGLISIIPLAWLLTNYPDTFFLVCGGLLFAAVILRLWLNEKYPPAFKSNQPNEKKANKAPKSLSKDRKKQLKDNYKRTHG